jgi:hypothetical protein
MVGALGSVRQKLLLNGKVLSAWMRKRKALETPALKTRIKGGAVRLFPSRSNSRHLPRQERWVSAHI